MKTACENVYTLMRYIETKVFCEQSTTLLFLKFLFIESKRRNLIKLLKILTAILQIKKSFADIIIVVYLSTTSQNSF